MKKLILYVVISIMLSFSAYAAIDCNAACQDCNSLFAMWKMDETNWNHIPGEVIDSMGSLHGIAYGNADTIDSGVYSRAGSFDGNGDYIEIPGTQNVGKNWNKITVSAWIKLGEMPYGRDVIAKDVEESGNNALFQISVLNPTEPISTAKNIEFAINPEGPESHKFVRSTTIAELGQWYHVVGTYDGSKIKIYINGVLEHEAPVTGNLETNYLQHPISIGAKYQTGSGYDGSYFNGNIDEVSIWANRALTAEEVSQLYTYGGLSNGISDSSIYKSGNLQAYWRLNDTNDYGPNCLQLTARANSAFETTDCKNSNGCVSFFGTSDNGLYRDNVHSVLGGQTWSVWVKDEDYQHGYAIALTALRTSVERNVEYGWWLWDYITDGVAILQGEDYRHANTNQAMVDALTDTKWHMYSWTVDSDGLFKHYVDGQLAGSTTAAAIQSITQTLNIGSEYEGGGGHQDGVWMQDMGWWNVALSGSEMLELYNTYTTGLFGQWHMNESSWDGTPGEVIDSLNSLDGTAHGDANTATYGVSGSAGSFDGDGDYVEIPGSENVGKGWSQVSVSAWIKLRSMPYGRDVIAKDVEESGNNALFQISVLNPTEPSSTAKNIEFAINPEGPESHKFVRSTTVAELGEWYHVVGTYDGSKIKIYINGVLEHEAPATGNLETGYTQHPISIGAKYQTGSGYSGSYFNGTIDEVNVWANTALTAEEVSQLYTEEAKGISEIYKSENLHAYWHLNDTNDYGPNGLDLTARSGAEFKTTGGRDCGACVRFSGSTDVGLYRNSVSSILGNQTWSGWMKVEDYPTGYAVEISCLRTSEDREYEYFWHLHDYTSDGAAVAWGTSGGDNYRYADATQSFVDALRSKEWHMYSYTVINSGGTATFKHYVDGQLVATTTASQIQSKTQTLNIGSEYGGGGGHMNGVLLQDVAWWNVSFSDADMAELYQQYDTCVPEIPHEAIGNASNISTNYDNLSIVIGGVEQNETSEYTGEQIVQINNGSVPIVEFPFNFSLGSLNLSQINITTANDITGGAIIVNIPLQEGYTKTVYVDVILNQATVCVKDLETVTIQQLHGACKTPGVPNETKVTCPKSGIPHVDGIYRCTYLSSINKDKVEGLRHSGVDEIYPTDGEEENPEGPEFSGSSATIIVLLVAVAIALMLFRIRKK
jgi:hypothetical protein